MTNKEFYKNALDSILESVVAVNKESLRVVKCEEINCSECLFRNLAGDCEANARDWLKSEHVEQVDWSKVKVDTPILVRESERNSWLRRYFAKFEGGKVYAWDSGKTSWSIEDKTCMLCWKYAKLAESEE